MRKRTRPFTEDCDAISEIIGELLMVVIAVIAFGVLAVIMLSYLGPSDTRHVDVDGWVNVSADTIHFRHSGGEAVETEKLEMILNLNGTLAELSSDDVTAILGKSLWQLGDIIEIDAMSRWGIDIEEDDYVGGTTIHKTSVIFIGTLLGEEIDATATATEIEPDEVPPTVTLDSPPDGNVSATGDITFRYTPNDADSGIASCNLILNGSLNQTDTTVIEGIINEFVMSGLSDGAYTWCVNCTDDSPNANVGISESRNLTVEQPIPPPDVCPLSYWKFDESSGETAEDSVGNNHGTIVGATWVPGISGSALRFDNVSPSDITYCYDYVTYENAENLRFTDNFTLEAWVKVNLTQPDDQYGRIIDKFSSRYKQGYSMSRFWRGVSDHNYSAKNTVLLEFYADDVDHTHYWTNSTTIITDDTWHYVVGTYNGTALKVYIDGILEGQTDTEGETIRVSNNPLMIGCSNDNNVTQSIRAVIDEVAVCGEALTAEEILEKYNNSKPNRDPISWWKFNETSGSTVIDCIDGNDGTIHGAQRTTGVEGGALFFNGSNYVSVPVAENLNMGNSDYTIEVWAWVNESLSYSDERMLVEYGVWWPEDNPYRNGTYQITSMNDTNFKTNFVGRDSADGSECNINWTDSNWHHLVGVFNDRENRLYTYYDGVQCSTTLENDAPSDNNNPLFFGSRNGTEMFFVGKLDEIKIYGVALTPEEIQEHYNSGKPKAEMVAQWHLDENTGTTAYDSKGSNNGIITNATWTTCVRGSALSFDGDGDYVTIPDAPSLNLTDGLTLMAWINTSGSDSTNRPRIISKRSGGPYELVLINESGHVQLVLNDTDGTAHYLESSTNVMDDTWHLVTGVWDATTMRIYIDGEQERTLGFSGTLKTSNASVLIGAQNEWDYFNGLIGEVTIYSGSLAAKEIKTYYYESKPTYVLTPVSLWHFDENSGTTATDSEDSNNGAIQGATWTTGVNGSALDFDGSSSYIEINDNDNLDITQEITIEAWVRPDALGDAFWHEIVSKRGAGATANYDLRFSADSGLLQFYWTNPNSDPDQWQVYSTDNTYANGAWHHVVATKSGTALPKLYVDGILQAGSCTYPATECGCECAMIADSNKVYIGSGIDTDSSPAWFFDGKIDEVSVYDSVLTAGEVLTRYNENKP